MTKLNSEIIRDVLFRDDRVIFAYLYGSFTEDEDFRDLDIPVYAKEGNDPFRISSDLKVALSEHTQITPDFFDIRVINNLMEQGDIFALLYLKNVFEENRLLFDKEFETRADFIEKYSMKYRECEGLIGEVLQ